MKENYEDFIRDVVITINVNLREIQERKNFAQPEELVHIEAKRLAYNEVLGILQASADEFKINRQELGL